MQVIWMLCTFCSDGILTMHLIYTGYGGIAKKARRKTNQNYQSGLKRKFNVRFSKQIYHVISQFLYQNLSFILLNSQFLVICIPGSTICKLFPTKHLIRKEDEVYKEKKEFKDILWSHIHSALLLTLLGTDLYSQWTGSLLSNSITSWFILTLQLKGWLQFM